MRLLFVGPPGAGKGTQAQRVADELGIAHVSTGDMFRALDDSTELGRRVNEIMESGGYVSDDIVIEMLEGRIAEDDASDGFILDGFPRTVPQAEALDEFLGDDGLDAVVLFEIDTEEVVQRMLDRGRADDTAETIRTRLEVYREQTEPLIGRYEERGLVRRVDASGDIEDITRRVLDTLEG
ncbi:MAG: adenylate kinase [Acidimicrobiia bacterium]|nr:adenylate kinase [Acidimicrobiia bacterium]